MRLACVLVFSLWATAAAGDLYRWIDPETGSVKYSSSPPPWHGDPAKERRAPKVLVIPAGKSAAPAPAPAAPDDRTPPAGVPGALEAQRKAMLGRIPALAGQAGTPAGAQALAKHLEGFKSLADEIDRLDPAGATARRIELEALIAKGVARSAP